ncbi:MAG: CHAT domain-containing protein [Myxococcota bacterium]|nr:CHAT domain-containing protein [Myxococcota bacterium]
MLESNAQGSLPNAPVAIDLRADTVTLADGSAILAEVEAGATAAGGNIAITAGEIVRVSGVGSSGEFKSRIITSTSGAGDGGSISIEAPTVAVEDGATIEASTSYIGDGGDVVILAAEAVRVSGFDPAATGTKGSQSRIDVSVSGSGDGGSITIEAPTVSLDAGGSILVSVDEGGTGAAGDISIEAGEIVQISGAFSLGDAVDVSSQVSASTFGDGMGGSIEITAPAVRVENGGAILATVDPGSAGTGGDITISETDAVTVIGRDPGTGLAAQINTSTFSTGDGGSITIDASDVTIADGGAIEAATRSSDGAGGGDSGNITITAERVVAEAGGTILAPTLGDGAGGKIAITAGEFVRVSGREGQFSSQVNTSTAGAGPGGSITIDAPTIAVEDGAAIFAATGGAGTGGDVVLTASESVRVSGVGSVPSVVGASTYGAGDGGRILIDSPTVSLEDGGAIQAATTGTGTGGDIVITASEMVRLSGVDFVANQSFVANINASTLGAGDGGAITIEAPRVEIEDGAVIAATTARTGRGGEVTIIADQLRVDDGSINSSSSPAVLYRENDFGFVTGLAFFNHEHFLAVQEAYLRSLGVYLPAQATAQQILAAARGLLQLPPTASIEQIRDGFFPNTQILPDGLESLEALRDEIGGAGNIGIDVERLILANGGSIQSGTSDGPGGSVNISASNSVTLSGRSQTGAGSFIQAASAGAGDAGTVGVTTPRLSLYDGAVITTEALASGAAGDLVLAVEQIIARGGSEIRSNSTATPNSLLESYEDFLVFRPEFEGHLGQLVDPGAAGSIRVDSDRLQLSGGSQISVFAGVGAEIPEGLGPGASSAGSADGDIAIAVRDLLLLEGGSKIEASVERGLGGSITIGGTLAEVPNATEPSAAIFQAVEPSQGVVLRDGSAILAQARAEEGQAQGSNPGKVRAANADPAQSLAARGGDIELNALSVLVCPDCEVNADGPTSSSEGSVVLDSPETAIESQVLPPNISYLDASSMLLAQCGHQPGGEKDGGGRFTAARWPEPPASAEDPLLAFPPFGVELQSTQGTGPALAAYQRRAREARASGEPLLAARAEANAARKALALDEPDEVRSALARARQALDQAEATPVPSAPIYLQLAYVEAARARQDPAVRRQALLAAHADLLRARESAERQGSRRAVAQAFGQLGALYAQEGGRDEEARYVTRRALQLAEQEQAADLLARWYAQLGRLDWRNARIDDALDAYRRAVILLGETRPEAAASTHADFAFRQAVEPVYLALVDLLLQSSAWAPTPNDRQSRLAEARQVVEQWKAAELRNYFRDSCAAEFAATSRTVESVDPQAAVIYPIVLPDRLELLVSRASGIARFTVAVSAEQLRGEVALFRNLLGKRVTHEYKTPARKLYGWLVAPYLPLLKQEALDTLVFVPGGALRTIPMAALHDGERFLMERYAVAITPSLDLLAPKPLDPHETNLLLAGLSEPVQGYRGLPAVPDELAAIEALYGGEVLLDESFDRAGLESVLHNEHPGVVHLASHAEVTGDPDTSFVLTHDDRLPMEELARLVRTTRYGDEPVELLLLSACETAVGDERAALGLAGMAIRAGARSAMGSLWWVSDEATSKLVIGFYEALDTPGISKARALQQAQRVLLETSNFQHPYYWAPFLVINNWL